MARRNTLNGIAAGLGSSFVGRNNDIFGFWGIGMLCLHAKNQATPQIEIDLLQKTISPPSDEFHALLEAYHSFLELHIAKAKARMEWVKQCSIHLEFGNHGGLPRPPMVSFGDPFACFVEITDDLDRKHHFAHAGWCFPHGAGNERQRFGFDPAT